ncbi:hypothetical protein [Pseudonocardia sediminis]|nr:hypothetical protein [Pseudonocardia sediminis]
MQATAAVDLSGHRVVTPLPDGSVRYAASNRMLDRWAPLWLTAGAASAGGLVEVVTRGPIDEPSWSWTVGPVYLSEEGRLTQAAPSRPRFMFVAQVGTATSPTSVFVDRFQSVVLAP